jgi:S-DNA-T family DNA segregation ATPase FtsK/SpoIIIE
MPYLVIIIDELSDLMFASPKEVEVAVMRLRAEVRASGIHLVLAAQRPSVDVLVGVIKSNLPTRISFQAATKIDSRTILAGPCWTRQVARTSWAKGTCSSGRRAPPG